MSQNPGAAESAQSLLRDLGDRAGRVRDRWQIPLAAGLVSAALGLAVMAAGLGVGSLAVVTGLLFIVRGAALALNPAYAAAKTAGEQVLAGLAGVVAGLVLLAWPGPTGLVLAVFAGTWLAASGGFQVIVSAARRWELPYWRLTLALGVLELLLGLWAMRPGATVAAVGTAMGVWAVVTGVLCCVLAFEIRTVTRRQPPRARAGVK